MARGIERRKIFLEEEDYQDFVDRLGKVLGEGGGICYAWSLMPNHFHLLLRTGQGTLVRLMQRFMTGYAVNFNFRHKRAGHLFQNRYKSIVVEEEPYFLELVRYIHLNPLRAKQVDGMKGLDRYPWSGHAVLMGKQKMAGQDVDEVLGRFGDQAGKARRKYRIFVEEGVSQGKRPELQGGGLIRSLGGWEEAKRQQRRKDRVLSDARVLGNGDFVSRVLREAEEREGKKNLLDIRELFERVSQLMGISIEELSGAGRTTILSDSRALISYLAIEKLGIKGATVAQELGLSRSSVCRSVSRGKELISSNPEMSDKILSTKQQVNYVPQGDLRGED
jgi:REP element-mobilizing transposase RayT